MTKMSKIKRASSFNVVTIDVNLADFSHRLYSKHYFQLSWDCMHWLVDYSLGCTTICLFLFIYRVMDHVDTKC